MQSSRNSFKIIGAPGIVLLLFQLGLLSCGSATEKRPASHTASFDPIVRAEADYDPLADSRDRAVVGNPEQAAKVNDFNWARVDSFMQAQEKGDSTLIIYRVQLFASQYYTEAKYEQQIAQEVFTDSVYLKYDLPYYKILLGNAATMKEGQDLLYTARSLGYYNSWLVEAPADSAFYRLPVSRDSSKLSDSLIQVQDLEPEQE